MDDFILPIPEISLHKSTSLPERFDTDNSLAFIELHEVPELTTLKNIPRNSRLR